MDETEQPSQPSGIKLFISFPKTKEDHRLQLVKINDSIFAIFHTKLESDGPINLQCEDWNLVLLAPIKSKEEVHIAGKNIICLNEIISEAKKVQLSTTDQLLCLTPQPPYFSVNENVEQFHHLEDDAAAFLYYYQLFSKLVAMCKDKKNSSVEQMQKEFLTGLCGLAAKAIDGSGDVDLFDILKFWKIELS